MKKPLILLAIVAGCGASDRSEGNGAGAAAGGGQAPPAERARGAGADAQAGLTGLYETGAGSARSQLCILDKGSGEAQFGINIAGANMLACQGVGSAVRSGDRLSLKMSGDQPCTIDATIGSGTVTLDRSTGSCDYYCGGATRFDGISLRRTGSGTADAMRARDVLGEPLCGSGSQP